MLAALLTVGVPLLCWIRADDKLIDGKKVVGMGQRLTSELKHLEADWTFKDSVAADVTVLAAAFTGIFAASGVLEALGDDTKSVLALATVASAVGVGLIGAAHFVVQALRKKGHATAYGFAAGSVLALAGTAGQLWVVLLAARDLELGWIGDTQLYIIGGAASLVLIVYGLSNTYQLLEKGITAAPPAPRTSAIP